MAKYRFLPTNIWIDDIFLQMSPEQKLGFHYLMTGPQTSWSGIFKLSLPNMGFSLNLRNQGADAVFQGLVKSYPDVVAFDEQTGEVALAVFPKSILLEVKPATLKTIENDLEEVESQKLLRWMIDRSKGSLKKLYLDRFRRITIEKINKEREDNELNAQIAQNHDNLPKLPDNQGGYGERELELEKELELEEYIAQNKDFAHSASGEISSSTEEKKIKENNGYTFAEFWEDYELKKDKARAQKKFGKLPLKVREEIRRILPFYKQETCLEENPKDWKPKRKHPATFLNQRTWEDYEEYPLKNKKTEKNLNQAGGAARLEVTAEESQENARIAAIMAKIDQND